MAPEPGTTAFDLLQQVSQKAPGDLKLDIENLDIRSKKVFIRGF